LDQSTELSVRRLAPDEWRSAGPLMVKLRPHLDEAGFVARIWHLQGEGFHVAAVEDESTPVRAVAAYRYLDTLFSGQNLDVDDLVTDPTHRSRGYGRALRAWLQAESRADGCVQLELDSGVQRSEAHRFYFREHLHVSAFHFVIAPPH
jgi:GNAT superfamily N-acetyltransferase